MSTILLTSAGTTVKQAILEAVPEPQNKKLAYVITASMVESDRSFVEKDRKNLIEMGFNMFDVDLKGLNPEQLHEALKGTEVIFVQGGNTFYLLKYVRESGFEQEVREALNRGVVYIGVSAGSIIASPTIETAGWKNLDPNDVGLTDLTAMNLVPFHVFVHYTPEYKSLVDEMTPKTNGEVKILTNSEAILIRDSEQKFLSY